MPRRVSCCSRGLTSSLLCRLASRAAALTASSSSSSSSAPISLAPYSASASASASSSSSSPETRFLAAEIAVVACEEERTQKIASSNSASALLERLKLPRNESILPALHDWLKCGNQFDSRHMKVLLTRLEWQRKFSQALEVAKWVIEEKPFEILETHYAHWLYYVGVVQGIDEAEEALSLIPQEYRKDIVYKSLFELYIEQRDGEKAKLILTRMKDQCIPIPTFFYNNLISFYDRNGLQKRIPMVLSEMKEGKIQFNRHSYNILLASKFKQMDLEGLEELWAQMRADTAVEPDFVTYSTLASAYLSLDLREKAESAIQSAENLFPEGIAEVKNLNTLIMLYGSIGRAEDVARLYKKAKSLRERTAIPVYAYTIEAFGEAGNVESAEQVVVEMEAQTGWHHVFQFNAVIGAYCKNGLMEKAEEVLKTLLKAKHQPNAITYTYLLLGSLKANRPELVEKNFDLVLSKIKDLESNVEHIVSRVWLPTAKSVIEQFALKGDIKRGNLLISELHAAKFYLYYKPYTFLQKAYEKSFGVPHVSAAAR